MSRSSAKRSADASLASPKRLATTAQVQDNRTMGENSLGMLGWLGDGVPDTIAELLASPHSLPRDRERYDKVEAAVDAPTMFALGYVFEVRANTPWMIDNAAKFLHTSFSSHVYGWAWLMAKHAPASFVAKLVEKIRNGSLGGESRQVLLLSAMGTECDTRVYLSESERVLQCLMREPLEDACRLFGQSVVLSHAINAGMWDEAATLMALPHSAPIICDWFGFITTVPGWRSMRRLFVDRCTPDQLLECFINTMTRDRGTIDGDTMAYALSTRAQDIDHARLFEGVLPRKVDEERFANIMTYFSLYAPTQAELQRILVPLMRGPNRSDVDDWVARAKLIARLREFPHDRVVVASHIAQRLGVFLAKGVLHEVVDAGVAVAAMERTYEDLCEKDSSKALPIAHIMESLPLFLANMPSKLLNEIAPVLHRAQFETMQRNGLNIIDKPSFLHAVLCGKVAELCLLEAFVAHLLSNAEFDKDDIQQSATRCIRYGSRVPATLFRLVLSAGNCDVHQLALALALKAERSEVRDGVYSATVDYLQQKDTL